MIGKYVTVRRYEGVTNVAEAARLVQEGFVPLIHKIKGFVAYYWVDAGGGVMVSTSIFHDQAGEEESNKIAKEWVIENLAKVFPNPPQITAGKVVAHS
jgi:hypothetical protein